MPAEQVIGSNVARIRAAKGMTQQELADAANLSRVSVGKIERGLTLPRASTLSDIARGLDVPLSKVVAPSQPLLGVRFRAKKRVNSREQILADVSDWLSDYRWLEEELDSRVEFALASFVGSGAKPKELAVEVRKRLELGEHEPIHNICGLLERRCGIKLRQLERATDSFFGLSVSQDGGGPAIVVNTWERISVERWIFTAAHELAHILIHTDSFAPDQYEEVPDQEKEADQFAGYFLLPSEALRARWEESAGEAFLDRVFFVKGIFKVSYKTVLHRLTADGIEDGNLWPKFHHLYQNRYKVRLPHTKEPFPAEPNKFDWNRAGEPDRLSEHVFDEHRLAMLVREAYKQEAISIGRAGEILGLSRSQMRERANEWAT